MVTLSLVFWGLFLLGCVVSKRFYGVATFAGELGTDAQLDDGSIGMRAFMGFITPPLFGAMMWIFGFVLKWVGWFLVLPISSYFEVADKMK